MRLALPLALTLLSSPAWAAPYVSATASTTSSANSITAIAICPAGTAAFSGKAGIKGPGAPEYILTQSEPGPDRWTATFTRAPNTPAPSTQTVEVQVFCATAPLACTNTVTQQTATNVTASKQAIATCPAGTYAIGGGFSILSGSGKVGVRDAQYIGLMGPTGFRANAHNLEATNATPWAVRATAICAGSDAIGLTYLWSEDVAETPAAANASYGWTAVGQTVFDFSDAYPLGIGLVTSHDQSYVSTMGPDTAFLANRVAQSEFLYQAPSTTGPMHFKAVMAYGDPSALNDNLHTCPAPSPLVRSALWRFHYASDLVFPADAGSTAVSWLHSDSDFSQKPEPFAKAFEALPVGVMTWEREDELGIKLDAIEASLDAERTPWIETSDPADALRDGSTFVIVVPRDEKQAMDWLSYNRRSFEGREQSVIVVLDADGEGIEYLETQW